jgi:hypothetical protein
VSWSAYDTLIAARYAQAAYSGDSLGSDRIDVSDGNAAATIFHGGRGAVVAIRGTDGLRDWWDNLHAWRRRCGAFPGSVHAGFCRQASRLIPRLANFLRQDPACIVGHSLGGAIVPLASLALQAGGALVEEAYSFEAPRTGDATFAAHYEAAGPPTWRVVLALGRTVDLVTRVPKSSWGYWHVGRLALLHPGLRVPIHDPQAWEAYRAQQPVSSLRSVRVLMRLRHGRQAHSMARVVEQLERMAAAAPMPTLRRPSTLVPAAAPPDSSEPPARRGRFESSR